MRLMNFNHPPYFRPETTMIESDDPTRHDPPTPICVSCEEPGATEFAFSGPWHRSCLAEFVTEYNAYLKTIPSQTSYQPSTST